MPLNSNITTDNGKVATYILKINIRSYGNMLFHTFFIILFIQKIFIECPFSSSFDSVAVNQFSKVLSSSY